MGQVQVVWTRGSSGASTNLGLARSQVPLDVQMLILPGWALLPCIFWFFIWALPCRAGGSSCSCPGLHGDVGAAPDVAAPYFIPVWLWVVGGDAQLCLGADQECLFFRDEEADLHSCPIIHGAGKIIHVTGSWGEPRFSSPSCCTGAGSSPAGKAVELWGRGTGRWAVDGELPRVQLPPAPTVSR